MKKSIINHHVKTILLVVSGILIGWLIFHTPQKKVSTVVSSVHPHETIWTCAMHPQIRSHEPGKCPICGMKLIPLTDQIKVADSGTIALTEEAIQLANVATSVVTQKSPVKEIRLYGKVQADERLIQSQTAHVSGRIESLQVNFTGEKVNKGQPLARLYSPELITAQQELLEAAKIKKEQPEIYQAAREKLQLWKLSNAQINHIEESGAIKNEVEVFSNTSGIVTSRRVNNGDHVSEGTILFEVADLSVVWVMFDAYESDLPFLKEGDKLTFSVQALPGTEYVANIQYIDPVIDPVTRVAKIRAEVNNRSARLKPEMFVTGIVNARLDEYRKSLVIPKSAVLWTGTRSIVYVKQTATQEPVFKMREVVLGPILGNSYVVLDGLKEGEQIVTQGTFSVDAAAQLEGKPSMMNRDTVSNN